MDNEEKRTGRFSVDDLPSLEQLMNEKELEDRISEQVPPESSGYYMRDFRQPYAPQPGYVPGYPYAQDVRRPEPAQNFSAPDQAEYIPQQFADPPRYPPNYPTYGHDPRMSGPIPSYEELLRRHMQSQMTHADDKADFSPRQTKEPFPFAPEPQNVSYGSIDALPSLAELQQALQEERRSEEQRAIETQQRERASFQQKSSQTFVRSGNGQDRIRDNSGRPASNRFVIDDLNSDDDEEGHIKRRPKQTKKKKGLSSLLKHFHQKNS